MRTRRMEGDRFLSIIVAAELINENTVALDMTIAATFPVAMQRMITVRKRKNFLIYELIHHHTNLLYGISPRSLQFLVVSTETFCVMSDTHHPRS